VDSREGIKESSGGNAEITAMAGREEKKEWIDGVGGRCGSIIGPGVCLYYSEEKGFGGGGVLPGVGGSGQKRIDGVRLSEGRDAGGGRPEKSSERGWRGRWVKRGGREGLGPSGFASCLEQGGTTSPGHLIKGRGRGIRLVDAGNLWGV